MTVVATLAPVVAASAALQRVLAVATRLAGTKSPVLLQGESGTGKDLVAQWMHWQGPRREAPFLVVDCPSIPDELLESELFGYEKGAFTDAKASKRGRLELASGGTVYLDRVESLSPALQAKLLRVVEEQCFERLGGTRPVHVDVRFVSASSTDLREAAARGQFREDLYHRLGVVPLLLPPLRERPEDIDPLADHFLALLQERHPGPLRTLTPGARALLRRYAWPGNVRELRAAIEQAVLLGRGPVLDEGALPAHLADAPEGFWADSTRPPTLAELELRYIRHVLGRTKQKQTEAAAILGISRKALWEKRRRHGLD